MYIRVKVTASAKKETLTVKSKDHLVVTVKEPAKQNLANKRIVELVANHFNLLPRSVRIISGHTNPSKILSIPDDLV